MKVMYFPIETCITFWNSAKEWWRDSPCISQHISSLFSPRNHAKATMTAKTPLTEFSGKLGSGIEMYVLRRSYIEEIVENNMGGTELHSGSKYQKASAKVYYLWWEAHCELWKYSSFCSERSGNRSEQTCTQPKPTMVWMKEAEEGELTKKFPRREILAKSTLGRYVSARGKGIWILKF